MSRHRRPLAPSTQHAIRALALTVITACASGTPPPGSPTVLSVKAPDALHAPLEVAGLAVEDSVRFPQPGLGTLYRYRGGGPLRADVYIYPRRPDHTVEKEASSFRYVLELYRRRGRYTDFRVTTAHAWSPVEWAEGREIVVVLQFGPRSRDSYYHVFQVRDQFVKVRITVSQGAVTIEDVRAFIAALLATMGTQ